MRTFNGIKFHYPIAHEVVGYYQDLKAWGAKASAARFKLERLIQTQPKAAAELREWGKQEGIL
jgi:hypothetical protein